MEEFELTYLAGTLPADLWKSPKKEILDIYIPSSGGHPDLRIRKSGTKYEITKKQPVKDGDSSHQLETTIPLTPEEYKELSTLPGKRVSKTRYYYSYEGRTYEVDVFDGKLAGLVVIDVEFTSAEEKARFTPPPFCFKEITQELFIAGGVLAGKSYADIAGELRRFECDLPRPGSFTKQRDGDGAL